jgi:hypothetical protein
MMLQLSVSALLTLMLSLGIQLTPVRCYNFSMVLNALTIQLHKIEKFTLMILLHAGGVPASMTNPGP